MRGLGRTEQPWQKRYYHQPVVKTTGYITLPLHGILNSYDDITLIIFR